MDPDTRWIQRYSNFESTYRLLGKALEVENPSDLERIGLIKLFEMLFELSWKLLKDYELTEGVEAKSPREVLKQAYQLQLIEEGHKWVDILRDRNMTAHTYKKDVARAVEKSIRKRYYPIITKLYKTFQQKKREAEEKQ